MFENSSYYIIPTEVKDIKKMKKFLTSSDEWTKENAFNINYLFNYAADIARDDLFSETFIYRNPSSFNIYMFEKECQANESPVIDEIRLVLFATGIAFLEFKVNYGNMAIEQIVNFAYEFKKADRADSNRHIDIGNKISLYTAACRILPEESTSAKLFFTAVSKFKYQTICFHMLLDSNNELTESDTKKYAFLLKRSYKTSFMYNENNDTSKYDMTYNPYDYTHWAGSQEGLVCICNLTGNNTTDYFLKNFQYNHLCNDYHFMYLMLLNQRFSAIKYINDIAKAKTDDNASTEQLNQKIIELKTRYTFHVISDEMIYQHVYSEMYSILDIDKLLDDIAENNEKLEMLNGINAAKTGRITERFLIAISILSLFSALIDSADYFDRLPFVSSISTPISFIIIAVTVIIYTIGYFRTKKKK